MICLGMYGPWGKLKSGSDVPFGSARFVAQSEIELENPATTQLGKRHSNARSDPGPGPVYPDLVGPAVDALEARLSELSPCHKAGA